VPGLKLRLYQHQVTSLTWMRSRECRPLTEADCRCSCSSSPRQQHRNHDLHRAATGGQTVLLRSRPIGTQQELTTKRTVPSNQRKCETEVRIDQLTGREVPDSILTTLPRSIARGGLLCDDPGLGKTITVLALILQTIGLRTSVEGTERSASGGGGVSSSGGSGVMGATTTEARNEDEGFSNATTDEGAEDELLFRTYWVEAVPPTYARPMMNKLIRDLARSMVGKKLPEAFRRLGTDLSNGTYDCDFHFFESSMK